MFDDDEMICWCSRVTAGTIRQAMRDGARTVEDIRRMTEACTVGRCAELSPRGRCCCIEIQTILDEGVQ